MGDQLTDVMVRDADEMFLVESPFRGGDIFQIAVTGLVPFFPDILADIGISLHPVHIDGFGRGQALDALQTLVGGMVRVGTHGDDLAILRLDDSAAADTAIRTGRQGRGPRGLHFFLRRGSLQFWIIADKQACSRRRSGNEAGAF